MLAMFIHLIKKKNKLLRTYLVKNNSFSQVFFSVCNINLLQLYKNSRQKITYIRNVHYKINNIMPLKYNCIKIIKYGYYFRWLNMRGQ